MMKRMLLSAMVAVMAFGPMVFAKEPSERAQAIVDKSIDYLKAQQLPDGGWQAASQPPAITAVVLRAIVQDAKYNADTDFVKKGYDKLLTYQWENGGIYRDLLANYNTAIAISSLAAAEKPEFKPRIEKAVAYLKSLQWNDRIEGGPKGDCGLTGRKIIVDTYGGYGRHGGGAFSGKDPSKVDRSAAYMVRYIAKNIVAAELAQRCEVQVAYAIGVADPVSVLVDTFETGALPDEKIATIVREVFDLKPAAIIRTLGLKRPIYQRTASYGHFGRVAEGPYFSWERTDRVGDLRSAAGLGRAAGR